MLEDAIMRRGGAYLVHVLVDLLAQCELLLIEYMRLIIFDNFELNFTISLKVVCTNKIIMK